MSLTCPKCQGAMRSYERHGVTVDQCTECRGVFLDRGELEHLVDAENRWHQGAGGAVGPGAGAPPPAPSARPAAPGPGGFDSRQASGGGGIGAVVGEVLRQAGQSRSGSSSSGGRDQYGRDQYGRDQYGRDQDGGEPHRQQSGRRKKSFLDDLFG